MADSYAHTLDMTPELFEDLKGFIESNPVFQDKNLAGTTSYTIKGKTKGRVGIVTEARTTKKIYIDLVGDDKEVISITNTSNAQWSDLDKRLQRRCQQTTIENNIRSFLREQRIK